MKRIIMRFEGSKSSTKSPLPAMIPYKLRKSSDLVSLFFSLFQKISILKWNKSMKSDNFRK